MLHTPLPVFVRYRPLILITGFLGAEKTTFIRKLLESLKSHSVKADVILNDYKNADLDAETIRDSAASLTPLAAVCAYCIGLDELTSIAMAAQRTRSPVLIVEIIGTADPTPLAETFTLLEKKIRLRPRWQVAVIDARRFGRRGDYDELEILQFQTASHWLASHRDEVSAEQIADLKARLKKLNPQATEITAAHLSTQLSEVITASRPAIERDEVSPVYKTARPSGHRLAHAFTGYQFLLPPVVSFDALHSPHIGTIGLFETSDYYPYYADGMYQPINIEERRFLLKPMKTAPCTFRHTPTSRAATGNCRIATRSSARFTAWNRAESSMGSPASISSPSWPSSSSAQPRLAKFPSAPAKTEEGSTDNATYLSRMTEENAHPIS